MRCSRSRPLWGLALLLLAGGCSSSGSSGAASDVIATVDVPAQAVNQCAPPPATGDPCAIQPAPADYSYPQGSTGIQVGQIYPDFVLEDCDGNPVHFADVLAGARAVLINVGAGWCTECKAEAPMLESGYFRKYCERGFRIVQVLFQDENVNPVTKLFCKQWRKQFGMTFPVLVDPTSSLVEPLIADGGSVPVNIILDSNGVVLSRVHGNIPESLGDEIGPHLCVEP